MAPWRRSSLLGGGKVGTSPFSPMMAIYRCRSLLGKRERGLTSFPTMAPCYCHSPVVRRERGPSPQSPSLVLALCHLLSSYGKKRDDVSPYLTMIECLRASHTMVEWQTSLTDDESRSIADGDVPPSAIMDARAEEMPIAYFFCDSVIASFVAENDETASAFAVVFDAFCIDEGNVPLSFIVTSEERGLFALVSIKGTLPFRMSPLMAPTMALCHRIRRKVEGDRCLPLRLRQWPCAVVHC